MNGRQSPFMTVDQILRRACGFNAPAFTLMPDIRGDSRSEQQRYRCGWLNGVVGTLPLAFASPVGEVCDLAKRVLFK